MTIDNIEFERIPAATVPEPATIWLFGTALVGIIGMRRKFKK
ncbi:MAG: PEP-CTERM sorting domain-containing protein [Smithella sp.]